ncbi:hypothetical protein R1flu_003079 [Riccia fluitans]|uniref:Uncharacterized protein n=1 Tax=Riccia fluitans TaxID=41844 RepID=A0ABD1Y7Z2_9MARC
MFDDDGNQANLHCSGGGLGLPATDRRRDSWVSIRKLGRALLLIKTDRIAGQGFKWSVRQVGELGRGPLATAASEGHLILCANHIKAAPGVSFLVHHLLRSSF